MMKLNEINNIISDTNSITRMGKIIEIIGLTIIADGPNSSIGDLCHIIEDDSDNIIYAEVVGFKKDCVMKRFVVKFAKWYFTTTAEAYK